jgi:hypothetical protein
MYNIIAFIYELALFLITLLCKNESDMIHRGSEFYQNVAVGFMCHITERKRNGVISILFVSKAV